MNFITSISLLGPLACGSCAPPAASRPVTIFAAASLKEAVTEIAAGWSKRTGRSHRLQFEATSTLARQIGEGAPADVFLAAAPEWLEGLETLGRFDWLSNRLVVVVRKDAREFRLERLESLALAGVQVPAGRYAKEALSRLGSKLPARIVYGSSVRDVLSKVSEGGAEAGIVYATDSGIDPVLRAAFTFPEESHPRILYSAGLLKAEGRSFFEALREPWAWEIAESRGFSRIP